MKVIFFGSSKYVIPVLNTIYNKHTVLMVVTTEQGSMEPVKFYCQTKKINCITVRKAGDLVANYEIQRVKADIGIVADFGIIIPQQIINSFPKGIINIHPSLLPKYRGPTPVQTAILNGDKTTGVSIILLDKLMDHGPILAQKETVIDSFDTTKTLYEKLFKQGALLLSQVLEKYEHNNVTAIPQNEAQVTFTKFLTKDDGFLDLSILKNENEELKIDFLIRAYYPWPGAWTKLRLHSNGQEKVVKLLPNKKIQVEGGKEMEYKDFINGYPQADKFFLDFLRKVINSG
jgi:methionyl-tRNA formyltransferase